MRQFIRYLYEYEKGQRTRNVGFVKVEETDRECTVHIHGKGLRLESGGSFRVCLFCAEEDGAGIIGIPQGKIAYMGPAINYRLRYSEEDVGGPENYGRIGGIVLDGAGGRRFAAVWDDAPVNVGNMRLWERRSEESPAEPEDAELERPEPEDVEPQEACEAADEGETENPEPETEGSESGETVCEEEYVAIQEPQEEVSEEPECSEPEEPEAEPPHLWKATKIQRRELSVLPRCEWQLANNHFLMHGYYNYRYLVFLDDGNVLKLGVPGIYHEKEAKAAAGFGFYEFIGAEETSLRTEEDEDDEEQRFGFWCRPVKRPAGQ